MRNILRSIGVGALCAVLGGAPMAAFAYTGQELASNARVSIDQARSIALKAAPGKIADEELEMEEGGSGLRYPFNIKRGTEMYEVGIDGQTGEVLESIV